MRLAGWGARRQLRGSPLPEVGGAQGRPWGTVGGCWRPWAAGRSPALPSCLPRRVCRLRALFRVRDRGSVRSRGGLHPFALLCVSINTLATEKNVRYTPGHTAGEFSPRPSEPSAERAGAPTSPKDGGMAGQMGTESGSGPGSLLPSWSRVTWVTCWARLHGLRSSLRCPCPRHHSAAASAQRLCRAHLGVCAHW